MVAEEAARAVDGVDTGATMRAAVTRVMSGRAGTSRVAGTPGAATAVSGRTGAAAMGRDGAVGMTVRVGPGGTTTGAVPGAGGRTGRTTVSGAAGVAFEGVGTTTAGGPPVVLGARIAARIAVRGVVRDAGTTGGRITRHRGDCPSTRT